MIYDNFHVIITIRKRGIENAGNHKVLWNHLKIFLTREHNPPHFHAVYGEYNGSFDIQILEMIKGDLPQKAQSLIREWASEYKSEIKKMWDTKTLKKLPPLE